MEKQRKALDKKGTSRLNIDGKHIDEELYKGAMLLLEDSYNQKTGRLNRSYGYTTIVKGSKFAFKIEFNPDYRRNQNSICTGEYYNSPEVDWPQGRTRFGHPHINIYTIGRFATLQRDNLVNDYGYKTVSKCYSAMHYKRKKLNSWEEDLLETAKKVKDGYSVRNQEAGNPGDYPAQSSEKGLTITDLQNISNLEELLLNDREKDIENLYKISMDLLKESYLKHEGTVEEVTQWNKILGRVYKGEKQNRIKIVNLLWSDQDRIEELVIYGAAKKNSGLRAVGRGLSVYSVYIENGERMFTPKLLENGEYVIVPKTYYLPGKWEENLIKDPVYLRQHDILPLKRPILNKLLTYVPKTAAVLSTVVGGLYGLNVLGTYDPSLARNVVGVCFLGLVWLACAGAITSMNLHPAP